MGCASSRLGSTVTHVPETATLPHRIRRRLDSIRRRRRVADSFINAKETTSLSKKLLLETTDSEKLGSSSPNSSRDLDMEKMSCSVSSGEEGSVGAAAANSHSMPLERDRADCIGEAVKRAIDDVMLEEELGDDRDGEDEDDAGRRVAARGEDEDGDCIGFGSPSFRVYCAEGPKPFGSFASIDYDVKSAEDVPKANHETTESFESQPTLIPDKEGSTSSSKSKERKDIEGTKKVSSCRKKGPLGMKLLLNMSCYSCVAHDRTRIVHN